MKIEFAATTDSVSEHSDRVVITVCERKCGEHFNQCGRGL